MKAAFLAQACATQLAQRGDTFGAMPRKRKYTDDELASAVAGSRNMSSVLAALRLAPRGANYETTRRRIVALGLDASHLDDRAKSDPRASDDEIRRAVHESRSFAEVLRKLGHDPGGRIQSRLRDRVRYLRLDTSHFASQGWRRGSRTPVVPAAPLEEVLVDGRFCQTVSLKRRLIAEGLKQAHCEICGNSRWNGSPIPLELDHINGRRDDNRLSNLRLLCPNCHALTATYRGRNIGAGRRYALTAGAEVVERDTRPA